MVRVRIPIAGAAHVVIPLANTVHTVLKGSVEAGDPTPDKHDLHSADSFAAADLGLPAFQVVEGGGIPSISLAGRNTMIGGRYQVAGRVKFDGKVVDPYYVTVNDLHTGAVTTEAVMTQTLDYTNALFSLDDEGIRLTVDRHDPSSFVELIFSSSSDWVLNPYTYGARLSNLGFEGFGLTPASGWTLSQTTDAIEAFFAFGPGGLPFDHAEVRPPDSLFTPGRSYSYDVGASDGAFEVAAAVPEPSTMVMACTAGAFGMCYAWCRRRAA